MAATGKTLQLGEGQCSSSVQKNNGGDITATGETLQPDEDQGSDSAQQNKLVRPGQGIQVRGG